MAITFQNATTMQLNSATSGALSVPSGVVDGDFLITAMLTEQGTSTPSITGGGWTSILTPAANAQGDGRLSIWYRRASGEPASYTLNLGGTYGNSAVGSMTRWKGVLSSGDPIRTSNMDTPSPSGAGGTSPQTSVTLTGVQSTDMAIHYGNIVLWGWDGSDFTISGPGGAWNQASQISNATDDSSPSQTSIYQLGTGTGPSFSASAHSGNLVWILAGFALIEEPAGVFAKSLILSQKANHRARYW
jgi:hypothetical protein